MFELSVGAEALFGSFVSRRWVPKPFLFSKGSGLVEELSYLLHIGVVAEYHDTVAGLNLRST